MMRTKRLHVRLAYVMRVDNLAKVHPATLASNPKALGKRLHAFRGRVAPGQYSGGIMRTRRLHAHLAYVKRADDRASVANAAASAHRRTPGPPCDNS